MKATTLLTAALAALAGGASGKEYGPVYLQSPYNWVPGPRLWPARVLKGVQARYNEYLLSGFTEHMEKECNQVPGCTSFTLSSEIHGPKRTRQWFGYLFGGGHIVPRDLVRDENPGRNVRDSRAYNAFENKT